MATAVVLCLPVRGAATGAEVLLGLKLRGFGQGRLVAPGGKIEPGETPAEAAARELGEETGLDAAPERLDPAGRVFFRFPGRPASDMDCWVFIARRFSGTPQASEELDPEWHPAGGLPAARMWDDSIRWLPRLLAGERFDATVVLAADNETVAGFGTVPWPAGTVPEEVAARRAAGGPDA